MEPTPPAQAAPEDPDPPPLVLRAHLDRLGALMGRKRLATDEILDLLAEMAVAYVPAPGGVDCGCALLAPAVREWTHRNHIRYAELALERVPTDYRRSLFRHIEGLDPPVGGGRRGAAAIRRIQEWLLPFVPKPTVTNIQPSTRKPRRKTP